LQSIEGVILVASIGLHRYRLTAREHNDIRPAVFRFAADHQLSLVGLTQEVSSLESIFQELTQKA
jgi:ABC-2 type transport system ATP-binding protein